MGGLGIFVCGGISDWPSIFWTFAPSIKQVGKNDFDFGAFEDMALQYLE